MNKFEHAYLELVEDVLAMGEGRPSRVGGTRSLFAQILTISDMENGHFPIVTTRQMFPRPIMGELFSFLQGYSDLSSFKAAGCNYWDQNAKAWIGNRGVAPENWSLGRVYGVQWRFWKSTEISGYYDQIEQLVKGIDNDPFGRRHIVTAWNPGELEQMCLPPCHTMFQCYVGTDNSLSMAVTMRSVDLMLGLPADIILYAALLRLICNSTAAPLHPGELSFMLGDAHIYENHLQEAKIQVARVPLNLPEYKLDSDLNSFMPNDLELVGYEHHKRLAYELNT